MAIFLLVIAVTAVAVYELVVFPSIPPETDIDIEVHVENRGSANLGSLFVRHELGSRIATLPSTPSGQSSVVRLRDDSTGSENSIRMADEYGNSYVLIGYFEGVVDGDVYVVVDGWNQDGLRGRVKYRTSSFGRSDWSELVKYDEPE